MRRMSYKDRRKFAAKILEAAFFGAIISAIGVRKKEQSLTRAQLGARMGREKTGISKLLAGPRNWQIHTISDLAEALDLRLEFALVDRANPLRKFTATGVVYSLPSVYGQADWIPYRGHADQAPNFIFGNDPTKNTMLGNVRRRWRPPVPVDEQDYGAKIEDETSIDLGRGRSEINKLLVGQQSDHLGIPLIPDIGQGRRAQESFVG